MRVEVCILAGGRSTRMGRDKTRLRLSGVSLLTRLKWMAQEIRLPGRIIRRDLVPRCGPLGGIFTALKTTSAGAVLFLSCDMPFVATPLLKRLLREAHRSRRSVFIEQNGTVGFPFLCLRKSLPIVEEQILRREFSLQKLAQACQAKTIRRPPQDPQLLNVNTPADWRRARELWTRLQRLIGKN